MEFNTENCELGRVYLQNGTRFRITSVEVDGMSGTRLETWVDDRDPQPFEPAERDDPEWDDDSPWDQMCSTIWGEADQRRAGFKDEHGDVLGDWLADIRQYGAAWVGDVWEHEAIRVENHPAFSQIGDMRFWDHEPWTWIVHCSTSWPPREDNKTTTRRAVLSMAGGRVVV